MARVPPIIHLRPERVPGWSQRGGLVVPVDEDALLAASPPTITVDGLVLARKHEFHVTLLDRTEAGWAKSCIDDAALRALLADHDWRARPQGPAWLIRDQRRGGGWRFSVVQLLDLPAHARFRAAIAQACSHALSAMPAHVTLYVAGDPAGIGLGSQARFAQCRVRVLPEVRGLAGSG